VSVAEGMEWIFRGRDETARGGAVFRMNFRGDCQDHSSRSQRVGAFVGGDADSSGTEGERMEKNIAIPKSSRETATA
jgi:hypothetical protein